MKQKLYAPDLEQAIAALSSLPTSELRRQWQQLHRSVTPAYLSRDLMVRAIAWELQAKVHGGLKPSVKRRLLALRESLDSQKQLKGNGRSSLKPGARLLREWQGKTHQVLVLEEGFEYEGNRFQSLTQLAQRITGVHWSGPRFFGLADGKKQGPAVGDVDE